MVSITIIKRDGEELQAQGAAGTTLMEAIRDAGVDELQALCGGCCSCATCHVHIDASFLERLPELGEDENDLLDSSEDRDELSRLSCQIPLTEALNGIRVRIAKED